MKQVLWHQQEIEQILSKPICNQTDQPIYGVSIDTRTLQEGDLFIALQGLNFDGDDFVEEAFVKGASMALTHQYVPASSSYIQIDDTNWALGQLAAFARHRFEGCMIGITGSVGKTTTKEMLSTMLNKDGVHMTQGNLNNHIGVPLMLARLHANKRFSVLEMGMDHAGEIAQLTHQVQPEIAVVTCVREVHLEYFNNIQEIADAKAEIFEGLSGTKVALLNGDDPYSTILAKKAREYTNKLYFFGSSKTFFASLHSRTVVEDKQIVECYIDGKKICFKINATGLHHAYNALAALGAGAHAQVDLQNAVHAVEQWKPIAGRGNANWITLKELDQKTCKQIYLVDESYNASPASVKAMLCSNGEIKKASGIEIKRRVAVLGDMYELGTTSLQLHRELATLALENKFDIVYGVGQAMQSMFDDLHPSIRGQHTMTAGEMSDLLPECLNDRDLVCIKGSFGMNMAQIVRRINDLSA